MQTNKSKTGATPIAMNAKTESPAPKPTRRKPAEKAQNPATSAAYARSLLEASLDPLVTISAEGKITDVNEASVQVTGVPRERLIGTDFSNYFTEPERAREGYRQVFSEGLVRDYPLAIRHTSGRITDVLYNASVYKDEQGKVLGVFAAARDITERKRAEERIQQQSKDILELSTPVMQVWQGVVAAPLIGALDSQRTQQFMERLLNRIVETNSPVALVDIMGVPTVDTQTAQHLIETISAVRLLGAQVVLTGVRPAIAQTLVHLGVDLTGIITRSSMSAGLQVALDILKLKSSRKRGGGRRLNPRRQHCMPAESISVIKLRNILLVTVPPDPDDETVSALQEQVLEAMARHEAKGLVLDISTVQILDSFFARTIAETVQMVALMGGRTVLAGMRASVAVTATQLGLTLGGALMALDVDRAFERLDAAPVGGVGP